MNDTKLFIHLKQDFDLKLIDMHEAKPKIRKISAIMAAILKNVNISNCSRVRCPHRAGCCYRDPRGTLYAEEKTITGTFCSS